MASVQWFEKAGYEVIVGNHAFNSFFQFSGTDQQRLNDLQTAFDDPYCKGVFCTRGGYGSIRIVDKLNLNGFMLNPKWLVGFSDITVLHCLLNSNGYASMHGVMPKLFFDEEGLSDNVNSLIAILRSGIINYSFEPESLNRGGITEGELVGGNLSLIYGLQGTPFELQTDDKILFLEDTGEHLYHIDRMMHNLRISGKLGKLRGLIIGDFSEIKDNEDPFGQNVQEIVSEVVRDFSFPVCFGFPGGHEKRNLALAFGLNWRFSVDEMKTNLTLF